MHKFQVFPGSIPAIKENRTRLNLFVTHSLKQHLLKVVIFCFAIMSFGIDAKIDGIKKKFNTATTVKEVHLSDVELEGSAEGIATVIKEILNDHSNS